MSGKLTWNAESIWQDIRPGDLIALPWGYPPRTVLAVLGEEGPVMVWMGTRWAFFSKAVLEDEPVLYRAPVEEAESIVSAARALASSRVGGEPEEVDEAADATTLLERFERAHPPSRSMTSSPHDAIFKQTFGQPEIARSELELLLPGDVSSQLDLMTLTVCPGSFVDEELQQVHSDLLYAVHTRAGGEALVYVLAEHQSSFDATLPFRLLRYVVRVWERWLRDRPAAKTLPLVIPVVLHHGEGAWRAPPELASVLDAAPELLEAARPFVPHFRFLLDDLAVLSPAVLSSRALGALPRLVQLALWASRSFPRLRDAAPFMRAVVATLVRDEPTRALLMQLYTYLWQAAPPEVDAEEIRRILLEVAGPQGQEDVVNAAEQLIQQGRIEGEQKGLERGRLEGLRQGIGAALAGRGVTLSEMGRARLTSCDDMATLTRWLTRAVVAGSEADVFGASDAP